MSDGKGDEICKGATAAGRAASPSPENAGKAGLKRKWLPQNTHCAKKTGKTKHLMNVDGSPSQSAIRSPLRSALPTSSEFYIGFLSGSSRESR